jgi:signal transduction histidine kinase/class 3 adenylate cyclase
MREILRFGFAVLALAASASAKAAEVAPAVAFCAGPLEVCEAPGARFDPVVESDLEPNAARVGVPETGPFTVAYEVPSGESVVFQGESNVHRVRTALGEQSSEVEPVHVAAAAVVRDPQGRVLLEVRRGHARKHVAVKALRGDARDLKDHEFAQRALPLLLLGWLTLSALQQIVAPRRSAQSTGALATAALNVAAIVRVAALQRKWTTWWVAAPALRTFLELGAIPALAVSGVAFYAWLVREPLASRVHRSYFLAGGAVLAALGACVFVAPLRGPAIVAAQLYAFAAAILTIRNLHRGWRNVHPTERRYVLGGAGAMISAALIDVVNDAVFQHPVIFGTGLAPIGLAIEIVCQALIVSSRDARVHEEVARLAIVAKEASDHALQEQERTNAELRRVDRLKDEFLANTSHELRTPLHGILGLTEGVLRGAASLDPTARGRLQMVLSSGRRLAALVDDILDFSKLKNQSIALREKNVDLREAVKHALAIVAPLAEPKSLVLEATIAADSFVRADENRLQQIFANLLGNAVKFTKQGRVQVFAERRGGRMFVSVQDTGIGIEAGARERIFESFEQADGSTAREFGGTGLGLAVTRKLVELHGGRVAVESAPGVGSTFTFDLRAADTLAGEESAHDGQGTQVPPRVAPGLEGPNSAMVLASVSGSEARVEAVAALAHRPSAVRVGRLLVADDDPVNIEVLRAQLEPEGYDVVAALDGRQALAAVAHEGPFDGVLLDVMMPHMTGTEAATRIRETHPHGTLPILMLTAKARTEDAVMGMRAGASDYIGKPCHREELLQRVDAHVQAVRTARTFRRFVPEDFLALLGVERFESLAAGIGQRHEVTVLFADVRNFTARSEVLGPEGTFRFINGCLERFEPVVRRHGGFVDKFIGDAIMALFPGDPRDAIAAAEGFHEEVRRFNAEQPSGALPLAIGVGVHRGPVVLGTVGGPDRLEATAIGDAVNVASRLEGITKGLGVGAVVSEACVVGAREGLRPVGFVRVRGRQGRLALLEILACAGSEEERAQKVATASSFEAAIDAYARGDLASARAAFEAVSQAAPLDRVAARYLARIAALEVTGVPEGFAGELDAGG